uniref:SGNH hydrolase-type esterase domain-containing protein n=1 Tax=Paramormyrops kingsleyae TaxID=1676925 RepID=A0A3B3SRX4_9TELE
MVVPDAPADNTALARSKNIAWQRTGETPSTQLLKSSSRCRMLKDAVLRHSSGYSHSAPAVTTLPVSDAAIFPRIRRNVSPQQPNANASSSAHQFSPTTIIVGDSIVRRIRRKSAVTYCFPGAQVNILKQIPRLLDRHTSASTRIFISGPIPLLGRGDGRFSHILNLNTWLNSACAAYNAVFINNFNLFWNRPSFYFKDGVHPSRLGGRILRNNIFYNVLNVQAT